MKKFNLKKAKARIIAAIQRADLLNDFDEDDDGRIIIFTDMFVHTDNTIWDASEAGDEDDDDDDDEDNHEILEESFPHDTPIPPEPPTDDTSTKE